MNARRARDPEAVAIEWQETDEHGEPRKTRLTFTAREWDAFFAALLRFTPAGAQRLAQYRIEHVPLETWVGTQKPPKPYIAFVGIDDLADYMNRSQHDTQES